MLFLKHALGASWNTINESASKNKINNYLEQVTPGNIYFLGKLGIPLSTFLFLMEYLNLDFFLSVINELIWFQLCDNPIICIQNLPIFINVRGYPPFFNLHKSN